MESILLSLLAILAQDVPAPQRDSAGVPPVPPPVAQERADCTQPTYASDMLVCASPELLALDAKMASLLPSEGIGSEANGPALLESQSDWFKRRSMCAFQARHAECLRAAYDERISVLEALAGRRDGNTRTCTRTGPLQGADLAFRRAGRCRPLAFRPKDMETFHFRLSRQEQLDCPAARRKKDELLSRSNLLRSVRSGTWVGLVHRLSISWSMDLANLVAKSGAIRPGLAMHGRRPRNGT